MVKVALQGVLAVFCMVLFVAFLVARSWLLAALLSRENWSGRVNLRGSAYTSRRNGGVRVAPPFFFLFSGDISPPNILSIPYQGT
jgi:hypothetical protein